MTSSASSILPLLRSAAPRHSRHFFTCRNCSRTPSNLQKPPVSARERPQVTSFRQTPFLQAFRSNSTSASTKDHATPSQVLTSIRAVAKKSSPPNREHIDAARPGSFPKVSRKAVAWWLLGSAVSVSGIVVFGALTRLTESGLSITEWRPITGTLPPLSTADWDVEFSKYRASPEFQKLNPNMNLSEFKQIFWMEYIHRLWGRAVGLTLLIPTVYFIARRQVSPAMARNLLMINVLVGLQGFVGWWMVKSGLKDDLFATNAHPRVSQYRLATHLGLAFTVYISMFWNSMAIFREHRLLAHPQHDYATRTLSRLSSPTLRVFRLSVLALSLLVGTTAISGAFVAGLDAGLIYNDFPYMGLGFTPPKSELWDVFYSRLPAPHPDLWWRNMLENPSLAQLDHRILATTTFVAVHGLFLYARFTPAVRGLLTKGVKTGLSAVLGLVWVQVTLGISTLVYLVPTPLAAAHQAGSLALLTAVILVGSRVWTPPRLARLVKENASRFSKHGNNGAPFPLKAARKAAGPLTTKKHATNKTGLQTTKA